MQIVNKEYEANIITSIPTDFVKTTTLKEGTKIVVMEGDSAEYEITCTEETTIYHPTYNGKPSYTDLTDDQDIIIADSKTIIKLHEPAEMEEDDEEVEIPKKYKKGYRIIFVC
jgi:hypothetical protein